MKAREYNWTIMRRYKKKFDRNYKEESIDISKEVAELILSGMSLYEALMEVNNRLIQKENYTENVIVEIKEMSISEVVDKYKDYLTEYEINKLKK
jgi:urease gamma subunit